MKIAVIIVSYNFERWIDRCLGSLLVSERTADVIIVDNCSQDHTVQRIQKDYPEVRLIQNKTNLGFGRANNIGMQIALKEGYNYIFLLNQDAWIDTNTIGTLVDLGEKHPDFGIISPVHLTGKGDQLDFGFADYTHLKSKEESIRTVFTEIPFINAAFWMIPTRILRLTGGFSPLFYHYGEDVDFVNRLHYHGFKIVYAPVFGYHDREKRVVTKPMEYRAKTVYLLTAYANVNHSFGYCFVKAIGGGFQQAVYAIQRKELKDVLVYLKYTFRLLAKSFYIYKVRKQVIRKAPTFIFIK